MKKDLQLLVTKIEEIHPNPFRSIKKDEFSTKLFKLADKYKDIKDINFHFDLMKVTKLINDSHTRSKDVFNYLSKNKFSFKIKFLSGIAYITETCELDKTHIGSELISLNNLPYNEVLDKFKEIITYENDVKLYNEIEKWIFEPDMLRYLGIIGDSNELILAVKRGKKTSNIHLTPVNLEKISLVSPREENIKNSETLNPKGLYWTKYFKNMNLFYMQYNECEDIAEKEVLDIVNTIKEKEVRNVVVDLRNNIGGSSLILDPLTSHLYENQDDYNPFVLLSNITYSAAIINALNMLDGKNTISIGTKTAGAPTKYGETTTIVLPDSKLNIIISQTFFEEKGYKYGQPLAPHIETDQSIEEYINAVDVDWEKLQKTITKTLN